INELKSKIGSRKGPHSPLKKHEYFLTSPNELLDTLANLDLGNQAGRKADAAGKRPANRDLAWHLYDAQTLIVADVDVMEQFLQADRQQPTITKSTSTSGAGPNMPMMPQGGGSGPPVLTPAAGGSGPQPGPGGRGGSGPPGGGSGPPPGMGPGMRPDGGQGMPNMPGMPGGMFSEKKTYMTVREDLKAMLDRMEDSRQVIYSSASVDMEDMSASLINNLRSITGIGAIPALPAITSAGAGLHTFSENRLTGVLAIELKREDDARKLAEG